MYRKCSAHTHTQRHAHTRACIYYYIISVECICMQNATYIYVCLYVYGKVLLKQN